MEEGKTVIVLGMHRTGTSMVGGVLSKLGIDMGDKLLRATSANPLGHFEDVKYYELNKKIIKSAGGNWKSPPSLRNIKNQKSKYKHILKEIFNNKESKIWGWKDPRTSLTIDIFLPYLNNPYFIVCHRDKGDVINSLMKRGTIYEKNASKLVDIYEKRVGDFFERNENLKKIDINYEDITENPERGVKKIINFLEINPTNKQFADAVNFIKPNIKMNKIKKYYIFKEALKRPWDIPGYIYKKIRTKIKGEN